MRSAVGKFSVIIVKLEAIVVGLASAITLGYTKIVVESDSKGAIDLIMSGDQCFNEVISILEDITSFTSRVDVVFSCVPRMCNKVANELVHYARTDEGDIIDCIDINKQPSFDHPLLKNHTVQGDGYKTGCYYNECQGFVQVDDISVTPNSPILKTSTYDQTPYEIKLLVFKDRKTGNWWLTVVDKFSIGYWPKEIFPKLVDGGDDVAFGAIAKKGKTGASLPMRSGCKPNGNYRHACNYFREVGIVDSNNFVRQLNKDEREEVVEGRGCYGLRNDKYNGLVHGRKLILSHLEDQVVVIVGGN